MNFIKKSIKFTNGYIKENLRKHILITSIFFVVTGIMVFFAIRSLPEETLREMYLMIGGMFDEKNVANSDGTLSFWGIFLNNVRACALTIGIGLIPFLFLATVSMFFNSALLGMILAAASGISGESAIMLLVKYILPHGVFEIPAIILSGAIGMKLCAFLCRKIFRRAKGEKFFEHIKGCVGAFVIYVIPLLLIAAFIESIVLNALYL